MWRSSTAVQALKQTMHYSSAIYSNSNGKYWIGDVIDAIQKRASAVVSLTLSVVEENKNAASTREIRAETVNFAATTYYSRVRGLVRGVHLRRLCV